MIKSILVAAAISLATAGVASAATVGPVASPKAAVISDLVQTGSKYKGKGKGKHYGHKSRGKHHAHKHHGKHHGHKYHRGPKGWHSYGYRPYNWYGRGCIVIGPLWYCP
jgi:hypothetical protein